jgi:transcriptional regulator GlxA family with amidase domain
VVPLTASLLTIMDENVEVIARRVGCASASHLSALFRRFGLENPTAYRERVGRSR